MPGSFKIHVPKRLVFTRGWGVLVGEELTGHALALRADARFAPDQVQLADFNGVTEFRVETRAVQALALINPWGPGAHRAVVAPNDESYGMARMYQILTKAPPEELKVFRNFEDALRWLGLSDWDDVQAALQGEPETVIDCNASPMPRIPSSGRASSRRAVGPPAR
jgi:hypothetical protein